MGQRPSMQTSKRGHASDGTRREHTFLGDTALAKKYHAWLRTSTPMEIGVDGTGSLTNRELLHLRNH